MPYLACNRNTLHKHNLCVQRSCIKFTINDLESDGICCDENGDGYYKVLLNGEEVVSGGEFGASETTVFGDLCPSSIDIEVQTDKYGNETQWVLKDIINGNLIIADSYDISYQSNTVYKHPFSFQPSLRFRPIILLYPHLKNII